MKTFTVSVVCLLFSWQILFAQQKTASSFPGQYAGAPAGVTNTNAVNVVTYRH